jgi:hypothetical protein
MANQNYATDVLNKIDERFYLDSKTNSIVNNGIEMDFSNGNNAVTIYNMDVVAENNYLRTGIMRYGQLVELGNGVQTFVLSQDKSFAISIDRGNREDSKMVPAIDEAVKRQVREVSIPTVDIYRLAIATAYAVANSQGATSSLAYTDTFSKILTQRAALIEAKVNVDDIVLYINPTVETYLWLDTAFKAACDISTADKKTGVLGTVMGMTVVVVPASYLIANLGFMMLSKNVLAAPTKFNEIKTGDGFPFGISGMVAFGRRYYDCFIPTNKGVAIRFHKIA